MEAPSPGDDHSLIEINEEDDLLLQHVDHNIDFSFSPLITPRSRLPDRTNHRSEFLKDIGGQKPSCPSPKDIGNKENLEMASKTDLGMPIFTEDPLQIKRRKKARGFNLRESLAWNRAFFTEEGVLNAQELSMLSVSFNKSNKKFLSGDNEGATPSVMVSSLSSDRSKLQDLEENLCNEFPARSQTEEKMFDILFSKSNSSTQEDPPVHTPRKVPLTKVINRSVPQGGGLPRPSPSYSQKRLATANKTSGIPKPPKYMVTKADSSVVPVTSKNAILASNLSKSNQNTLPVNIEKKLSLKSSSAITKDGICRTTSAAKYSALCSRKKMVKPPYETQLSDDLQTPQVCKGTGGFTEITEPVIPADTCKPISHANFSKVTFTLLQNDQHSCRNISSAQFHAKPSALRMPSPSLGYFSQAKVSVAHSNPLQKYTLPHSLSEPNIPTMRKPSKRNHIGEQKPSYIPFGRLPKVDTDATSNGTTGAKMHVKDSSISKSSDSQRSIQEALPSDVTTVSDNSAEHYAEQVQRMPHPGEIKQTSDHKNQRLEINDNTSLVEHGISKQSKKAIDLETNGDIGLAVKESSGSDLAYPHAQSEPDPSKQIKESTAKVDNPVEHPRVKDVTHEFCTISSECRRHSNGNQSVENDFISDSTFEDATNNTDQGSSEEVELSWGLCKEQMTGVGISCSLESVCSSTEEIGLSIQTMQERNISPGTGSFPSEENMGLTSNLSSEESQTALSEIGKLADCGLQHELKHDMFLVKDKGAIMPAMIKIEADSKQDACPGVYPLNAVPFSDEWLAALEAAGEDILKMKRGAVQNSPPNKSLPEPGPWSPVKRHTQEIGPFDCTKYTNLPPSDHA